MRIPLATDLKTRTGAPDKDARLKNAYVEGRGDPQAPDYQTVVRKRPSAQGGISVGTGQAQGGIGFSIGATNYFIGFWNDTLTSYTGGGTTWNGGTGYFTGDHVSFNFVDYWAIDDNIGHNSGNNPSSSPNHWSRNFVPEPAKLSTSPSNLVITININQSHIYTNPCDYYTRDYTTYNYGTSTVIDNGSGTLTSCGPTNGVIVTTMDNYLYTAAEAAASYAAGNMNAYVAGYDYYRINGTITQTWNGSQYIQAGKFNARPY